MEAKPILVTEPVLARMLNVSTYFLMKLRRQRKIPYYKIGGQLQGSVRYDPVKVRQALDKYFAIEDEA